MLRRELHYHLPPELIAQQPAEPRDASRLLVLDRRSGAIAHHVFRELGRFLRPGDCLVLNDTRVIPARFFCRRASGGRVEGLFLHSDGGEWRVLLRPAARLKVGERLSPCAELKEPGGSGRLGPLGQQAGHADPEEAGETPAPPSQDGAHHGLRHTTEPGAVSGAGLRPTRMGEPPAADVSLRLVAAHPRGEWAVVPEPACDPLAWLARHGQTPLPPYIHRAGGPDAHDLERYQAVYAARPGAVAAPTAGLHFTPALLDELAAAGVERVAVTLHVGPGTFQPVDVEDLADHPMHAEYYAVAADVAERLAAVRRAGGRIVAVGTTAARVLESLPGVLGEGGLAGERGAGERRGELGAAASFPRTRESSAASAESPPDVPAAGASPSESLSGWTRIFIYPPYTFRNVDVLLTNFHLPESTLLALVMALGGVDAVRAAYAAAVAERYRFYSYGDAMVVV